MAFWLSLFQAMREIIGAPFHKNLWWQLAPLLGLWLLLEIYHARHKKEQLGWNSALANGITLFWITLAAIQPLFIREINVGFPWTRFFVILPILGYSLFITYISFTHMLGEKISYSLALPWVVFYLAILAVLWGNSALDVNKYIILGAIILWAIVGAVHWVVFTFLPEQIEN